MRTRLAAVRFQVDGGDQEVINIRETSALGPLLYGLIGLGLLTLLATVIFWWLTRPKMQPTSQPLVQGETDG